MRVLHALLLVLALTLPQAARADEDESLRSRVRDANAQFNMGNYKEALAQFQAIYRASGKHALLYNIAQCYRQLGDLKMAAVNYRSFIRLDPDNAGVPVAKELLAKVEEQIAREGKVKSAPPTGVQAESQVVPWGQKKPAPAATAAAAPAEQRSFTVPAVTGAAALVCVAAGAVFGLQARSAADDWRNAAAEPAWSDARSRAQSAMTRANVAWTAAAVLAAATAATLLIRF
ncbi:MAG TPA: tetratricopeptide repeat protein [Myxococcales bacterium]|nr:tetratricopeptide repeat protein [Myxococcales bacterium]